MSLLFFPKCGNYSKDLFCTCCDGFADSDPIDEVSCSMVHRVSLNTCFSFEGRLHKNIKY